MNAIGIDIGGTGIKLALVDTTTGQLLTERIRVLTPKSGTTDDIVNQIKKTLSDQQWDGNIGVGFPTPLKNGICRCSSNLHPDWKDLNIADFFAERLERNIYVANDVDVAALAELRFGSIPKTSGLSMFIALGTGIGTALIHNGEVIMNTELGHVLFKKGEIAERYASNKVRLTQDLSWKKYGSRLNQLLQYYEFVLGIEAFVIGGGISKKFEKYRPFLSINASVQPAILKNNAGVIGAAMLTTCMK